MKTDFIALASLLCLSAMAANNAKAAPLPEALSCRGGGGTLGLSTTDNSAVFFFTKSNGPAGAGLAPGQCAFLDRPVAATGDATCLKQINPGATAWIFPAADQRINSYYSSNSGKHWMREMLDASKFVTFYVVPTGSGVGNCFSVTHVGI